MIPALQAGLTVIAEQGQLVFGLLLLIGLSAWLAQRSARLVCGASLLDGWPLALGLTGWLMPLALLALVWMAAGLAGALLALAVGLGVCLRLQPTPQPAAPSQTVSLLSLIALVTLLRLAFVSQAVLPAYFDSAQHYLLIRNLLQPGQALPALTAYYHQGFHLVTAYLIAVLGSDIGATMLVFGQLVLALLPVSSYFLVRQVTGSHGAGLLAFLLAAFGWYMPAHAVNWGKYPALLSLALLPGVLWTVSVAVRAPRRRALQFYAALSIAIVTLFHSRSLIVLGLAAGAWMLSAQWLRLAVRPRWLVLMGGLCLLGAELIALQREAILLPLLDPYLSDGLWVTLAVLLLAVLAWRTHAAWVFAALVSLCGLLGSVFIPVPVPGYGTLTLLDRPYVEMAIFLPLAFVGGLGAAELLKIVGGKFGAWVSAGAGVCLGVFLVAHAVSAYNVYPSVCCALANRDDLAAITWLDRRLPPEAVFGVSATAMNVLPAEVFEGYSGSDAGIWILPLTGRRVSPVPNTSAFEQAAVHADLCAAGIEYLYAGAQGQRFNVAGLQARSDWYALVLSVGAAGVYEVRGCP